MEEDKVKLVTCLDEAVKLKGKSGIRYDNSEYWKRYYVEKFLQKDLSREKEYALFLRRLMVGGDKVLDLATGYGFLPVELYRLGFEVIGVDRFQKMIKLSSKYFLLNNAPIKVIKADVTKLPFDDGEFDVVTAISIAEHLVRKEIENEFLKEVVRVLKPNGVVLIHVPIKSCLTRLKRFYRINVIKDLPKWSVDDDGDVTHRVWFSYKEYKKMFESNGLVVESVFFNYVRSNEKILSFRLFNKLMKIWSYDFMPVDKMGWKGEFCSKVAVSGGFVCRKLI